MRAGEVALVVFFVALLVLAALYSWHVWAAMPDAQVSASGWIALVIGSVLTLAVGGGLMFLVFYSSRHGYDDPDRGQDSN
jgi:hypothetical protein